MPPLLWPAAGSAVLGRLGLPRGASPPGVGAGLLGGGAAAAVVAAAVVAAVVVVVAAVVVAVGAAGRVCCNPPGSGSLPREQSGEPG